MTAGPARRLLLAGVRDARAGAVGLGLALRVLEEDALAGLGIGALEALPALDALQIGSARSRSPRARWVVSAAFLASFCCASCCSIMRFLKSASRSARDFGAGAGLEDGLEAAPGAVELRSFCSVVPSGQDCGVLDLAAFRDTFEHLAVRAQREREQHESASMVFTWSPFVRKGGAARGRSAALLLHLESTRLIPFTVDTRLRIIRALRGAKKHASGAKGLDLRRCPADPRPLDRPPARSQPQNPAHPQHHPQHSRRLGRDGHGDRGAARDRHRAGGRDRHRSQEHVAQGAGRRSDEGQALRERHRQGPDHHQPRHEGARRARPHAPAPDLGAAGDQSRRAGGGHRHQPRPAGSRPSSTSRCRTS